ncbi:MAG: hypothetical protein IJV85_05620 [Clostridia bacterium]|nr:hypothetical protein [Clostridia bacterium]
MNGKKTFIFTIDDNIRFLKELTENQPESLFDHPYARVLKELYERFDVKIQLNLFYETEMFTLAQMTERYRDEWAENAHWLKMSFHSRLENVSPYEDSDYEEVYKDCQRVQTEVLRFAGEESLATTTTIHYCKMTSEGLCALKNCGIKGLLGLYGTNENPSESYQTSASDGAKLRNGEIVFEDGLALAGIDIVLNSFTTSQILAQMQNLRNREIVKVMIHEQYFYSDYPLYQPDFQNKLVKTFAFLKENGFKSRFLEELI